MKDTLKSIKKKSALLITALLLMGSFSASAQITLPSDDGNVDDVPPRRSPIDGFIITGLVVGAAIGMRKHITGLKK